MKRFRAIVILLFSIALPYSATATMLGDIHCHHDGLGALLDGSAHKQHDHAAMHEHHMTGQSGCDCAVKCNCQHHCAGGGSSAALAFVSLGLDFPVQAEHSVSPYRRFISDPQSNSPFRPPMAAPPGAA